MSDRGRSADCEAAPVERTSHPAAAAGGAAGGGVAGAVAGSALGGPAGGLVGAAIGAILGGLAGEETAAYFDPTCEDAYWRECYKERPYVRPGESYDLYRSAYAYGYETRRRSLDASFAEVEEHLARGWESFAESTGLSWRRASAAVRDGWDRVESSFDRLFRDEDDYWRGEYANRSYAAPSKPFETYRPAFRYGYRSRVERLDAGWEEVEPELQAAWERFKGASSLSWEQAREAVRDGWRHVEKRLRDRSGQPAAGAARRATGSKVQSTGQHG